MTRVDKSIVFFKFTPGSFRLFVLVYRDREAECLKRITGVWGILRGELARERIIYVITCMYSALRCPTNMNRLGGFRHRRAILLTLELKGIHHRSRAVPYDA